MNQLLKEKTMITAQRSSSSAETQRDKVAANRINVKSCTCLASQFASSSQLQSASADIADTGSVIVNRETVVSTKRTCWKSTTTVLHLNLVLQTKLKLKFLHI